MSANQGTLPALAEAARALGYSLDEAIGEKTEEMRSRAVMSCIPNRPMNGTDHRLFVDAVLSSAPPPWLLAASSGEISGRITISVDVKLRLEEQQRWRCAVCGLPLTRDIAPHVDHVIPISLGGANEPANLQLLCRDCNLGKSNMLTWVLGAPYDDTAPMISKRKRYCVLKRDGSRCRECGARPPATQLYVTLRVPQSSGGTYVIDNLQTLCSAHHTVRNQVLRRRVRAQVVRRRR